MKHHIAAVLASVLLIAGCTTTKTITVTQTKHIAVKVDKDFYHIDKAPEPVKVEDLKGKDKNGQLLVLGTKIIDLYGYIGNLQSQILNIKEAQDKVADRIEKETGK